MSDTDSDPRNDVVAGVERNEGLVQLKVSYVREVGETSDAQRIKSGVMT